MCTTGNGPGVFCSHVWPSLLPCTCLLEFYILAASAVSHIRMVCLLLLYAIVTVFQLYHGNDMMYEMRRRKPERTLRLTQGLFNLPLHIGMEWQELVFDDAVSYIQRGNGLQYS